MLRTARGAPSPGIDRREIIDEELIDQGKAVTPILYEISSLPPPPGFIWEQFVIAGEIGGEPYRTIMQVIRPAAPEAASGVVVLEPWHRAGYWTLYSKVSRYVTRANHISAFVVANRDVLETVIKPQNPEHFADLFLPETELVDSEVIAQAGAILRSGALARREVRRLILGGQSTEGYWVRRYIVEEHGKALLEGRSVFDGYFPAQSALSNPRGKIADIDVPVLELQGESEFLRSFARGGTEVDYRRDDAVNYRLYEVPGMPHVCTRDGASARRVAELDCANQNWSQFPLFDVFAIGLDNLVNWVDQGVVAPEVARITTTDDGRTIVRDEHENALGGLRTSMLEVPTATVHATNGETPEDLRGLRCDFFAWDEPFANAKLASLYGKKSDYLDQLQSTLDRAVKNRTYLTDDAREIRAAAELLPDF